jgi:hypothetical protein
MAVLVLNVFHPGHIFRLSRVALEVLRSGPPSTEMETPVREPVVRRGK